LLVTESALSENASSSTTWLSLMRQSNFAPQKSLPLSVNQAWVVSMSRGLLSRFSYIAKKNSLSFMIGPPTQTFAL